MKNPFKKLIDSLKRGKCPKGYREVGKDEVLQPGCSVVMDMKTGKNYVKIEKV